MHDSMGSHAHGEQGMEASKKLLDRSSHLVFPDPGMNPNASLGWLVGLQRDPNRHMVAHILGHHGDYGEVTRSPTSNKTM